MMEKYSNQLEELVAERTAQLEDEKRKTDALLYQMLPRYIESKFASSNSMDRSNCYSPVNFAVNFLSNKPRFLEHIS